jgi:acyl carrier protein phosphodiesterase
VKHVSDTELGRRIAVNFDERTATHKAMIGPDMRPLVDPLSEEWGDLSARYDALADQSDRLYAELERRANA